MVDDPKTSEPNQDGGKDSAVTQDTEQQGCSSKCNDTGKRHCRKRYSIFKNPLHSVCSRLKNRTPEQWLAIGTWILAFVTIGLLIDARHASERQLRAYVSANKGAITIDGTKIKIFFVLKNSGQTPSYKLRTEPKTVIYRPPGPLVFEALDRSMKMGAVIGPGDEFEINSESDVTKDVPDGEAVKIIMESIQNGTAIIYVHGRVDYEDVFEKLRTLYYRFKAIKHASGQLALQPEAEGNYEKK